MYKSEYYHGAREHCHTRETLHLVVSPVNALLLGVSDTAIGIHTLFLSHPLIAGIRLARAKFQDVKGRKVSGLEIEGPWVVFF